MSDVKFGVDELGDDHWCEEAARGQHHASTDCGCNPDPIQGSGPTRWSWTHHGVLGDGEHFVGPEDP